MKEFNKYYLPKVPIQERAIKAHGLTRKELKKRGAIEWTRRASNELYSFLSEFSDLPIIAHGVHHDRDDVLRAAFKRVDNIMQFPEAKRWRDTLDYAERIPNLSSHTLDEVLL